MARFVLATWASQVVWLLEYEPTWFPEFGFAVGAALWGVGCLVSPDYHISSGAAVLPCLAVVLGAMRGLVLLRLWYEARVVLASLSALLWAWIWWGLAGHYRIVPMMGLVAGVFLIEMLTAAKFSVPCARELLAEYFRRRAAR